MEPDEGTEFLETLGYLMDLVVSDDPSGFALNAIDDVNERIPYIHKALQRPHIKINNDFGGGGKVTQVIIDDVLVWSWAWHIDGPPAPETIRLLEALQDAEPVKED